MTPEIFIGTRRSGKTERLLEWLADGKRIDAYPGWSRIVLTTTLAEADRLRKGILLQRYPGEDTYRWVFSIEEWQRGHIPAHQLIEIGVARHVIEIGVDDADLLLAHLLRYMPTVMTMTGSPWNGS